MFYGVVNACAAQAVITECDKYRNMQLFRHIGQESLRRFDAAMDEAGIRPIRLHCVACGAPREPVACSYCLTPS